MPKWQYGKKSIDSFLFAGYKSFIALPSDCTGRFVEFEVTRNPVTTTFLRSLLLAFMTYLTIYRYTQVTKLILDLQSYTLFLFAEVAIWYMVAYSFVLFSVQKFLLHKRFAVFFVPQIFCKVLLLGIELLNCFPKISKSNHSSE